MNKMQDVIVMVAVTVLLYLASRLYGALDLRMEPVEITVDPAHQFNFGVADDAICRFRHVVGDVVRDILRGHDCELVAIAVDLADYERPSGNIRLEGWAKAHRFERTFPMQ